MQQPSVTTTHKYRPVSVKAKNQKFHENVTKRGHVSVKKKGGNALAVTPLVIGFFVFVVFGSLILQVIRGVGG